MPPPSASPSARFVHSLFGIPRGDGIHVWPEGTERTWLLTYTDEDTRIVRAGVDGGRSTVRDLGLGRKRRL